MNAAASTSRVVLVCLALAAAVAGVAAPRAGLPGLYYDEAFMAQQAKDFFEPERGLAHPASTRQIELFGRPFPLRNAVYLGALKSQLFLPGFALFGTGVPVVRLTTLFWSLLGLLLVSLWAARVAGAGAAALGAVLVATDPSWWFLSLYEWGPFTTSLLCRGGGFLLVASGWARERALPVAVGGVLLGLGVFNRADFVMVIAGTGAALLALRPSLAPEALGARRRLLLALAAGGLLGSLPMWTSLPDLLATTSSPVVGERGDLAEKLRVLWSLLDGSHFFRLMEVGGRFDRMFEVPSFVGLLGVASLLCAAFVAVDRVRAGRRPGPDRPDAGRGAGVDPAVFFLLAGLATTFGTLALPGAVRAHHLLNGLAFVHLLVACVALELWRRPAPGAARLAVRGALAAGLAAVVASGAFGVARTYHSIEESGGRGRWSAALDEVARELEAAPESTGVSLDWGFHEPLLFLTRRARLEEPIWTLRATAGAKGAWRRVGRAGDLYLVHDQEYDLFGLGPSFLAAARRLEARAPGSVRLRVHRDRQGAEAFRSVRVERPHEVVYGRFFRIELLPGGEAAAGRRERELALSR